MSSPVAVQSLRQSLLTNRFKPVPVQTATKTPLGREWNVVARSLTSSSLAEWPHPSALSTGVLCDDLIALDVDTDDAKLAQWITHTALTMLGGAPRRFRENSPRCLLLYRPVEGQWKSAAIHDAAGRQVVELRGYGTQVVVDGVHPSKVPYQWSQDLRAIRWDSLTQVSVAQLEAFGDSVAQHVGGTASRSRPAAPAPVAQVEHKATKRERAYALQGLEYEVSKLRATTSGRNNALNHAAFNMGTCVGAGWITRKIVEQALWDACAMNGYRNKRGDEVARKTLRSGLESGIERPRDPLPDEDVPDANFTVGGKSPREALSGAKAGKRNVALQSLQAVQETPVSWLWPGWLPAGMLTLLSGAGGTGKSTLAFNFAAAITTAGSWPDGQTYHQAENVLIWSSEDDLARTIKPRLMAAGADLAKVHAIQGTRDEFGEILPFDPSHDIDTLREAAKRIGGVALLIIDPIVSAIAGDMHKANDVRRGLQPIVDFAAEFHCAVLGITHFAKNTSGRNATERVIGSQAFAALARMVLVTAKEEDSDQRVFTRAKSNISVDTGGIHYTIEAVTLPSALGVIETTRAVWGAAVEGNARSILASVEGEAEYKPVNMVQAAAQFLIQELQHGAVYAKTLIERAEKEHGWNEAILLRARKRIGVQASKAGFKGAWMWSLPLGTHVTSQSSPLLM